MPTDPDTLDLRPELRDAVAGLGWETLTPIQAQALPVVLTGQDVTGQAMTGSGKTGAFGLGLLQRLDPSQAQTQALVLCPTRELADQVTTALRQLASRLKNTRVLSVCGGQAFRDQRLGLVRGSHVVVGTPGRLLKHLERGHLDLTGLRVLVLDEADRLLDMGFSDQVMALVNACPAERQTLLFSATFPPSIEALRDAVQRSPLFVSVAAQVSKDHMIQRAYHCHFEEREALVGDLLAAEGVESALVFCETRAGCEALCSALRRRGAAALPLHGQLSQRSRDETLIQFANGSVSVLVATNVAARGLDVPALPLVVIAEVSPAPEDHVHRIGRTGRAGQVGLALTVVCGEREGRRLSRIEETTGRSLPRTERPPRGARLDALAPRMRTLLLLAGRTDKLRKGDVLGALVKDAGVPFEAIGRVDLLPRVCAVALERSQAAKALRFVQNGRIKKKKVRAKLL